MLCPDDQQSLQNGVNEIVQWTQRWLLNLNIKNIKWFFGRDVNKDYTYTMLQNEQCVSISRKDVRNLGVMCDEKLNFREHIQGGAK